MVDQLLLVQEARRVIHDPKHFDQFTRELENYWKEVELPQLECQYHVDDERQLREKFKEQGRSLDVHYKSFSPLVHVRELAAREGQEQGQGRYAGNAKIL